MYNSKYPSFHRLLFHSLIQNRIAFFKTSTGFAGGGATLEDVALLAAHVGPGVQVKASGGIAGLQDAAAMLAAGAARLGTSRVVGEVKRKEERRI